MQEIDLSNKQVKKRKNKKKQKREESEDEDTFLNSCIAENEQLHKQFEIVQLEEQKDEIGA